jgi:hypothetical protein
VKNFEVVMAKRQYSDEDKAAALATLDMNGGNLSKTAKKFGIAISTLQSWRDGRGTNTSVTNMRNVKKGELADKLEQVAHAYTDHLLSPVTINDTGAKDAAVTVGTAIDKMRLLRGLPTEIISVVPQLVDALKSAGLDPVQAFNDMIMELANADRTRVNTGSESEAGSETNVK